MSTQMLAQLGAAAPQDAAAGQGDMVGAAQAPGADSVVSQAQRQRLLMALPGLLGAFQRQQPPQLPQMMQFGRQAPPQGGIPGLLLPPNQRMGRRY